jgi:hypothetical protein
MRSARVRVAAVVAALSLAAAVPAVTLGTTERARHNHAVASTPGGLDSRGGHHCWTRCGSYGKYTGQYHCHRSPCNRSDIRRHRRHGH